MNSRALNNKPGLMEISTLRIFLMLVSNVEVP